MENPSLPKLISFAVYDGIPPKEEGMDPKVFWFWPYDTPIDAQLNQVGLYLTFAGFCRDFRSSKDCEYIQTDHSFTCFDNIGADVCLAATFNTTNPVYYRILLRSIHVFKSACLLFCNSLVRDKNNDVENIPNLTQYLEDFLRIFRFVPIFNTFSNVKLWIKCEEAIASMKVRFPTITNVAFVHKNFIVHNTISMDDLLPLYIGCEANFEILTSYTLPKNERASDSIVWLVGVQDKQNISFFSPTINISNSSGSPIILSYNDLIAFIIFSPPIIKKIQDDMAELKKILEPLLPGIEAQCVKMEKTMNSQTLIQKVGSANSKSLNDSNLFTNLNLSSTNSKLFSTEKRLNLKHRPTGSLYLFSNYDNSTELLKASKSSLRQEEQQQQQQQNQYQPKSKYHKNKNINQQHSIDFYSDNGSTQFFSKYAQAVAVGPTYNKFSSQSHNERMISFLGGNDNKFVRFCGLNDNGSYIFMEKLEESNVFLDGITENNNSSMSKNICDATTDYLNFMKEK